MKTYHHLFFDLDHTLWDFERNSEETISELFHDLKIQEKGVASARNLYRSFEQANRKAWDLYHQNLMDKETLRISRFVTALAENGLQDEDLAETMAQLYLKICPTKPHLFPNTIEILDFLAEKYPLHLISNGFLETTLMKVQNTILHKYFKSVTTPTHSGFKKPEREMFEFALQQSNCQPQHAIMIGDDLKADILGAKRCGMDQVYFNPEKKSHQIEVTFEIENLVELKQIFG